MAERAKRERKSVVFYSPTEPQKEPKKLVQEGKGTKLGDIPNATFRLNAFKAGDELLDGLHVLLFKTKGKATTRKRDIHNFSGFVFSDTEKEAELKKLEAKLSKWTQTHINSLLGIFDIPKGSGDDGTKDKKVERLLEFLMEPKVLSDKDLAAEVAKKKEKAAKAKLGKEKPVAKRTSAKKEAAAKAEPAKRKAAKEDKATEEDAAGEKKGAKTKAAKPDAKSPVKKTASKRKASDADEKHPAKKAKKAEGGAAGKKGRWPSAKQLEADVAAILQESIDADKEVTLKLIYEALGEKYNLSVEKIKEKKAAIKDITAEYQNKDKTEKDKAVAGEDTPAEAADEEKAEEQANLEAPAQDEEEGEEEPVITEQANTEGDEYKPEEMEVEEPAAQEEPTAPEEPVAPEEPAADASKQANGVFSEAVAAETPEEPVRKPSEAAKEAIAATSEQPEVTAQPTAADGKEPALLSQTLEDVDKFINQF